MKKISVSILLLVVLGINSVIGQDWTFGTEESFEGKYKWAMVYGKPSNFYTNQPVAIVINNVRSSLNGKPSGNPENNVILNLPEEFIAEIENCEIDNQTQELKNLYKSMGLELFGYVKIRFAGDDQVFSWAVNGNTKNGRCTMYISQFKTLDELNKDEPYFIDYLKTKSKLFVRFIPKSNCATHEHIDMEFSLAGSSNAINHVTNK